MPDLVHGTFEPISAESNRVRCTACGRVGYDVEGGWKETCERGHLPCRECGKGMFSVLQSGRARKHPRGCPSPPGTHVFSAKVTGHWDGLGNIEPVIECLNDPDDPHRDCKYTESGDVGDCEEWNAWEARLTDPEDPAWWGDRPDFECGGFEFDGQHFHPDSGCGVIWTIENVEPEVVAPTGTLHAGDEFTVRWQEGCPLLKPTKEQV